MGKTSKELLTSENWEQPTISVAHVAEKIVHRFTCIKSLVVETAAPKDTTLAYTKNLMTLALLWFHHRDISREGDGKRLLTLTPILLHLFRRGDHKNYAIECAKMLMQYHYLMSDRLKTQLLYSRYVNTQNWRQKHSM